MRRRWLSLPWWVLVAVLQVLIVLVDAPDWTLKSAAGMRDGGSEVGNNGERAAGETRQMVEDGGGVLALK